MLGQRGRRRGTSMAWNLSSHEGFGRVRVGNSITVDLQQEPELILIDRADMGWHVVATSSLMFRRDVLGFCLPSSNEVFRLSADFILYNIAHLLAGTITMSAPLSCYRMHGKNGFSRNPAIGGPFNLGAFDERKDESFRAIADHIEKHKAEMERVAGRYIVKRSLAAFTPKKRLTQRQKIIREVSKGLRRIAARWRGSSAPSAS